TPSELDFGPIRIRLARHFGFCFGVENAIEIAYRVLQENPGKRIFLLSEVIHHPSVNADLQSRGIRFLMKPDGTRLVDFSTLTAEDVVVVPAFGTTIELQRELEALGVDPYRYDATCPFVEKVWKRANELGRRGFSIILHGKRTHEETRATFSHSRQTAPTLIVLDMEDAQYAISFLKGRVSESEFRDRFADAMSEGFDPSRDLLRIGVVNQTTMLATDTKAIAQAFRDAMLELYGEAKLGEHFADTRDTLCYATYENQSATSELTRSGADLAVVVGGYNSSNTSHLVELCEQVMPTYYIKDEHEILSATRIRHFDLHTATVTESDSWLPSLERPVVVAITAGASCPDRVVNAVIERLVGFFPQALPMSEVFGPFATQAAQSAN
ncbi:MAG: 4-hydroxy-3-methylbut-2-enyl diphosphate reductase, partial [Bdellovibrionales bacterium]|nr:4-hydroxy-3-methylbut-2-enyl diphosphate reductase [Bdellovibrionales bacterium]